MTTNDYHNTEATRCDENWGFNVFCGDSKGEYRPEHVCDFVVMCEALCKFWHLQTQTGTKTKTLAGGSLSFSCLANVVLVALNSFSKPAVLPR